MSDPALSIDTDKKARLRLNDQLEILCLPTAQRRMLLRDIAKQTRADAQKNIREQQTVSGQPMAPRANKTKRKMFRKLAKGMVTKVPTDHTAVVTWKNAGQAKVADRHHRGIPEHFTAKKAAKTYGVPDYSKPATVTQAKALNQEGYRRPVARKRGKGGAILKKVPVKWIMDNMTLGQAGLILRLMRTKKRRGKQQWDINLPARPILGAAPADAESYLATMAQEALANIKRA